MKKWCMCTKLKMVARDMFSTCSICGGQDAYGASTARPQHAKKVLDSNEPPNAQMHVDKKPCEFCKMCKIILKSARYCAHCGSPLSHGIK
jgi:hypothetical protein